MDRICAPENYACHLSNFGDFLADRGWVALACLVGAVAFSVIVTYAGDLFLGDH